MQMRCTELHYAAVAPSSICLACFLLLALKQDDEA